MSHNHKGCLLLNSDGNPLKIVHWHKSIIWAMQQHDSKYPIYIIKYYDNEYIHGVKQKYLLPSIAQVKNYINLYNKTIAFSRKNLFIRDNFTCQYCGQERCISQLTYDHVVPKSRFPINMRQASTNWSNIVTACRDCNRAKANKTPSEAGMELLKKPSAPKYNNQYLTMHRQLSNISQDHIDHSWNIYFQNKYEYRT